MTQIIGYIGNHRGTGNVLGIFYRRFVTKGKLRFTTGRTKVPKYEMVFMI